uniref:ZP domain-containing protein n=1 Tax=Panagrellus redivivus TaxID=6233 RepID=A0A7E4UXR3_PANRE
MLPLTYLPILFTVYNETFSVVNSYCLNRYKINCYFADYNRFNVHFRNRRIPLDDGNAIYRQPQVYSQGSEDCMYGCYVMKYLRENGTQKGCIDGRIRLPMTSSFALGSKVLLFGVCHTHYCNTEKLLDDYGDRWYPLPSNITTVALTTSTASTSTTTEIATTTMAAPTTTEVTTSTRVRTTTTEKVLPTEVILHPNGGCGLNTIITFFTVVILLLIRLLG